MKQDLKQQRTSAMVDAIILDARIHRLLPARLFEAPM